MLKMPTSLRKRFLVTLTGGLFAFVATAQETITPEQYAQEEAGEISLSASAADGELAVANPLDLILQCQQPSTELVDLDNDGNAETLRMLGYDIVSKEIWALRGPSALGPSMEKAKMRSQAGALEYLQKLAVTFQNELVNSDTQTDARAAAGEVNGEMQLTAAVSVEVSSSLINSINTSGEGYLRNGRFTGARVVSHGDGNVCMVVRYDIPLDQSDAAATEAVPTQTSEPSKPQEDSGNGYDPLPPGSTGSF